MIPSQLLWFFCFSYTLYFLPSGKIKRKLAFSRSEEKLFFYSPRLILIFYTCIREGGGILSLYRTGYGKTAFMEFKGPLDLVDIFSVEKLSGLHMDERVQRISSEIPCRISSDPHESRHHRPAVSTMDSVKLNFPWRCGILTVRREDPVDLYSSHTLYFWSSKRSLGRRDV